MGLYLFECKKCGQIYDEYQRMNDEHKSEHCGFQAQRIYTVPQVNPDMMYQFVSTSLKEPKQIHSRRQYNKHLKENGLVAITGGVRNQIKKRDTKGEARKLAKKITKSLYEKGAMPYVTGKENPKGRDNANRL